MRNLKIIKQVLTQSVRCYERPRDMPQFRLFNYLPGAYKNNFDKNWNPRNADGSTNYLNLFKVTLLVTLVNLNAYQFYELKCKMDNGEETSSDIMYDKYGIDTGMGLYFKLSSVSVLQFKPFNEVSHKI